MKIVKRQNMVLDTVLAPAILFLLVFAWSAHAAPLQDISIPDVAMRLADKSGDIRLTAAMELDLMGQCALKPLMQLAEHGSPLQRRGAVIGLSLLPSPALGMDTLLKSLNDTDVHTRSLAAHSLGMLGKTAAPFLAKRLADLRPHVRDAAAFSLKLMGSNSIPALIRTLQTEDSAVRAKAAWLLGRLGPSAQSAVPALIRALETDDIRAMHVIAEAIDLIGADPAMIEFELALLGSESGTCMVGHIGNKASQILTRLLGRGGTPLAQMAFRTLAEIGKDALPALREGVNHGTPGQRIASALLLVEIDPDAVLTLPEDLRETLSGVHRPINQ